MSQRGVTTVRDAGGRFALDPRTYRWADRLSKLGGVALVAAGLEVGGGSVVGVALGASGAALALSTVFVERTADPARDDTDE
ncbi:hypothetical protein [Halosimplex amylolyticum]|uniref:hypothetical protein n=1 Tax=Halosimplex amylolyticum TaxID=3396616 RepID=UPI003F57AC55